MSLIWRLLKFYVLDQTTNNVSCYICSGLWECKLKLITALGVVVTVVLLNAYWVMLLMGNVYPISFKTTISALFIFYGVVYIGKKAN